MVLPAEIFGENAAVLEKFFLLIETPFLVVKCILITLPTPCNALLTQMEHPDISETAVVGFPHPVKGESVFAFVVLKETVSATKEEIVAQVRKDVRKHVAGYAVPEFLLFARGLPKTRSGKVMRRLLRQIAKGDTQNLGDTSTLADPSVVDHLLLRYKKLVAEKQKAAVNN